MKLIILIGNIGSGKSTLAKQLVKQFGYLSVSRDGLRYGVGSGLYHFDMDLEPELLRIERYMFQSFTDMDYDIVLDETNVRVFYRQWYINLAKEKNYTVMAVEMPKLSKVDSIKRRLSDNHGDTDITTWEEVWDNFDKNYAAPSKAEGFDSIIQYTGDISCLGL